MSIVVFIWACAAFCLSSSLLRQLDPDLQVLKKRGGKVFFSDSKFLPFYPPTDTVPFNTRDNFIHLYIIVSNSIGKLLQHASELDRAVMSSFFLNAMSFLSQSFQAQNKHCNKKLSPSFSHPAISPWAYFFVPSFSGQLQLQRCKIDYMHTYLTGVKKGIGGGEIFYN